MHALTLALPLLTTVDTSLPITSWTISMERSKWLNPITQEGVKMYAKNILKFCYKCCLKLLQFDQAEFFIGPSDMDSSGFLYVPENCQKKTRPCRLHIVFHGCQQGRYISMVMSDVLLLSSHKQGVYLRYICSAWWL